MKIKDTTTTYRLRRILDRLGIATTGQLRARIVEVAADSACGHRTLVEACALIGADPAAVLRAIPV